MKYFDYAATSPLDEEAANIFVKTATQYFGNSQSLHDIGDEAHSLLEKCRFELAQLLNVEKDGIYFTSGGSEGNFLAIEALLSAKKKDGNHIITTIAEHSSIKSTIERLKKQGYRVTYLPFNKEGLIDVNTFAQSIQEDTVLAVIQHGNSEIGTVQPIEEIGNLCKQHNIFFHSDCVQTFGKIAVNNIIPFLDSMSLSGHKFYGPKGTGAVYIRPQIPWSPSFPNTTHERGFRPGTVNVPGITAMTVAAKKAAATIQQNQQQFACQREVFIQALAPVKKWTKIHGATHPQQLPHIVGMGIDGIEGQWFLLELNRVGFAISTGSACHNGMHSPASSMLALGYSGKKAKEFFRISLGCNVTDNDVVKLAEAIVAITLKQKNH